MITDTSYQLTVSHPSNITSGSAFVQHLSKRLDTGLTAHYERLNRVKTRFNALQDAVLAHHSDQIVLNYCFQTYGIRSRILFCVGCRIQFRTFFLNFYFFIVESANGAVSP